MQVNRKTVSNVAIALTATVAILLPIMANAQSFGFDPYSMGYGYRQTEPAGMGLVRLLLIAGLGALGFGVGWFLSPHAKAFRRAIFMGLGAIALLFIMFNGSFVSWALAWVAGHVAFFVGLGYWLSNVVSNLSKTPTTFGSAKWADASHMKAHKVFDPKPEVPKAEPKLTFLDGFKSQPETQMKLTPNLQNPFAPSGMQTAGFPNLNLSLQPFGGGTSAGGLPTPFRSKGLSPIRTFVLVWHSTASPMRYSTIVGISIS